jgi:hypothetical protein
MKIPRRRPRLWSERKYEAVHLDEKRQRILDYGRNLDLLIRERESHV